jgi:hypothetical protein
MVSGMTTIYYKSHKNRNREVTFFNTLRACFPGATIVNQDFPIECKYLDCFVDTDKLIAWLEADQLLPTTRRRKGIETLTKCPPQIRVALRHHPLSFDVVIVQNNLPYYWEFHEEQHRELTDARRQKLFTPYGNSFGVERYLQRLVRDVWRIQYFRPYTIVWSDWFSNHQATYQPLLLDDFQELHESDEFSFQAFCQI